MKKILLALLLLICACSRGYERIDFKQKLVVDQRLNTFKVDMNAYKNMKSFDHQFLGITPNDLLEIKEEKITGLFLIGYSGCHVCQDAIQYLNEVAKENDIIVYYLDPYNKQYPLNEKYEEVYSFLKPVIEGEYLSTPLVFALKDGEFQDHHLGLVKNWNYQENQIKDIKELKNIYQKLINKLY